MAVNALRKKKRGRRSQDMRYLQSHQCATIVNIIRDRVVPTNSNSLML